MPDDTVKRSEELYIVELDGVRRSEHRNFIEALKSGLELKRLYPRSKVNLRDAHDNAAPNASHAAKRTWGIGRSVDTGHAAAWLRLM